MSKQIHAGILGASGYAGLELTRLLLMHPHITVAAIGSVSFKGQKLSEVYPSMYGICELPLVSSDAVIQNSDVVFAALPHGLSEQIAQQCVAANKKFIDLGADFRLQNEADYQNWYHGSYQDAQLHAAAVYGLPELFRKQIANAPIVANPGCYPTSIALAIAPALSAGMVQPNGIVADSKSGVTGAGRGLSQNTHFPDANEAFSAYKVASHRHTPEIEQTLSIICGQTTTVTFVPHLLPVNRGILSTVYAGISPGVAFADIVQAYKTAYAEEPFVRLLPQGQGVNISAVRCSNYCDIQLYHDTHTNLLIATSVIDNMVKGAAGQAVQNMNLICGLPETTGLTAIPTAF
ncbi:N-acetyl-gamma-glutamyl-phosphate reductase [Eubacteriales bacterium OttesenSCG-928-N14]|nr:N-acetyl-gamma-glutamyl-phosphate reductase [Eubacteriales bacterium OttesenSCG-928-N14]